MNTINIAQYIDHTMLKSDSTYLDIKKLCQEAITHNFYAVCINGSYTSYAMSLLKDTPTRIATTIGFPLGSMHTRIKALEAEQAAKDGSHEIDMVLNIGYLKSKEYKKVMEDIRAVKHAVGKEIIVKVIFENCLLTQEEKKCACALSIEGEADFIKTSTGFATGRQQAHGATKEDLILMLKEIQGTTIKVKAAGGVKDTATALEYINLGISRIGTSSGIALIAGNSTEKRTILMDTHIQIQGISLHVPTLIEEASKAMSFAYTPYSKFNVGAVVVDEQGTIYSGCNVENASYGLTSCAERNAIFNAVSQGMRSIIAICVVADTPEPVSPCGGCRQVMREFTSDSTRIILSNTKKDTMLMTPEEIAALLFFS